ncbi:MAG: PEP-CTERM sorting domain-containing protein, partial [Verrucomicrobiota bacterium]
LRLAEDKNPPGFSGFAFIGIDGNSDGKLDLFVGVNNAGSTAQVGIWRAGSGANTSPFTTSLQNPASVSYAETSLNYGWTPINATIDPTSMSYDVDNGGNTDQFLSFVIPFADLVSMFSSNGIAGVNENSIFSYVAATATQENSLNQDINGVNGGVNSTMTWQQLGALTQPTTATGLTVPEPSTVALAILGAATSCFLRRSPRRTASPPK